MERVLDILAAGAWPAAEERDSVTLPYHDRHRRRLRLSSARGTDFLLDLPQTVLMREGDGLKLAGGGYVRVHAAEEALLEVKAATPAALARLAWHLGNRHTELQILGDRLRMRRDHVLEQMLAGLEARLSFVEAPFEPERGAYAQAHLHAREGYEPREG